MSDDEHPPSPDGTVVEESQAAQKNGAAFPVVGVGASAGGLEALTLLLRAMPADTGMGFVIVQHLAPDHESSLAEILSRATKMKVREVRDEPTVEPNRVYVIPPGRDMVITGGKLRLLPQERHARHRGIDQFFRSLAADCRHKAIGVVLSGAMSDGTLGLEEIKAEGGITFAQDDSAQHDSMPRSAVASGCVDFVLSPEKIAGEIARIARHPYVAPEPEAEAADEPDHARIAQIIQRATGVDFTHYKANTIERRIKRRMLLHKHDTLQLYETHLTEVPEEVEALFQDILISVTSFFRDPAAFDALARTVFPKLLAGRSRSEPLRIWTLGCSTGEEAYSLAMTFTECAEAAGSDVPLQLFATDLNHTGVGKARTGLYAKSIAQDVLPERLRRFFTEEDGGYRICKAIRDRCIFSRHNVLADPPFSRVDLISCRNLLIYLEPVLQQQIVPLLHYALKPGGFLWLGSSETAGTSRALFEVEDARNKIYVRRPGAGPPGTRFRPWAGGALAEPFPRPAAGPRETARADLPKEAERVLLTKYAPPGVVISAAMDIMQFRGDTGAYLAPAAGAPSLHLLKMLREGLLVSVRAAILRAGEEGRTVRTEGLRVKCDDGFRDLAVEVVPIESGATKESGFLVLFDEGERPPREQPEPLPNSEAKIQNSDEVPRLMRELTATREYLQSVIEQQEAANEELQSANEEAQSSNEEMQSVNEELETSKEEIQSSNEELATVNEELNNRSQELTRLNEALQLSRDYAESIVDSGRWPLLVLDAGLRVKTANRAFCEAFRVTLKETEGRLIYDLGNGQWNIPVLRTLLEELLPQKEVIEDFDVRHTFQQIGPRIMLLNARGLPQRAEHTPLIILAIEDITERSEHQTALRRGELRYRRLFETARDGVLIMDPATRRILDANPFMSELLACTREELLGKELYEIGLLGDEEASRAAFRELKEVGFIRYENLPLETKAGARREVEFVSNIYQEDGVEVIQCNIRDITERKRAEHELAEKARLLDLTHDAIIVRDMEGHIRYWNQGAEELYGWSRAEALGKVSHLLLQTEFPAPLEQLTEELHRTNRWIGELIHTTRAGERITVLARKTLDRDSAGNPAAVVENITNITERKQTEQALRESEARFRSAVGLVTSLIWTNNAAGMMEGEQPGWSNFTGQTEAEYRGYGWVRAVHEGDAQPTIAAWEKAVAEKRLFEFEHRLRRHDGEWRLCSIRAMPLLRDDGTIREWLGVHTDITERERAESALRKSEERYRALIAASSDVVYQMSADWSEMGPMDGRGFFSSFAEPTDTWLDHNIFPEDHQQVLAAIHEAIRTKSVFALEHRVRRADGSAGWTVSRAVPLFDAQGEIVEWFGAASDVTERRQSEEALRATEEFNRSIIGSSPDCIKVLDLEGNLLSVESGQELLGIEDLAPFLNQSWINLWEGEHRLAAGAAVESAAATGEGKFVGFFRTLRGEDKWWDVAISPIRDAAGKAERLLAVSRDVTDRHKLEESLIARAEDLARADRSKDEFLAMLAHELRNPLAPMRNSAEILQTADAGAEACALAQGILNRQIENMSRMIDDLLDVSRITEGKIELHPQVVALADVVNAAASLARPGIIARGQELTITLPPEPIFLNADATRLDQVFGNLLNNACKYSASGCHISVNAERSAALGKGSPEVIVRVRDDGMGIAPELLPRIFDLFVQANRSLDRTHGGLGIGLTLVQRLVKLHGGSVEAHSEGPGHGSEFIVRLPILPSPAPAPPPPSARPAREASRRMLIVDDHEDSVASMATLQRLRGHEVRTASTGPDAVIDAAEFLPEVVLLDIGLPGMNGFEVARQLRAMPALAQSFLVAMSGYGSPNDLAQARAAGFDEYLVKPADLTLLREWLRRRD